MIVTQPLRQFAYGLGGDIMPGDYLFAPHESDITDIDRPTIRVTAGPHTGTEVEVPRERIRPTDFIAMESPILPVLGGARNRLRSSVTAAG